MSFWQFLQRNGGDVLEKTNEHLALVVAAMLLAIGFSLPLGVWLARRPAWQKPVLTLANIAQTIPSLALFGFLLPVLGLGAPNAIAALFLYSLLPLVRNTVAGLAGVDPRAREAAVAMGLTPRQVLLQVELPLAAGVILAGVRTATVLCVGVATIASFIAAGGLGEFIQNGLRANDNATTLAGAVPAAALALGADGLLGTLQSRFEIRPRETARARTMRRVALVPAALLLLLGLAGAASGWRSILGARGGSNAQTTAQPGARIVVGSKDFTESRILAEVVAQMLEARGANVVRKGALGGALCHQALVAGQIDIYPEYSGTAFADILKHAPQSDVKKVYETVKREYAAKFGVETSAPLGFSNGFAMLIRGADARQLGIETLSQAVPYARNWKAGFGPDFITRADGWPGLSRAYNLKVDGAPRSMDLSLINRALAAKQVDLIAGNETDGLIPTLDLFQLRDDKNYFPPYQGIYFTRRKTLDAAPALREVLAKLAGALSTEEMQKLNYAVDGKKQTVESAVRAWLAARKL